MKLSNHQPAHVAHPEHYHQALIWSQDSHEDLELRWYPRRVIAVAEGRWPGGPSQAGEELWRAGRRAE